MCFYPFSLYILFERAPGILKWKSWHVSELEIFELFLGISGVQHIQLEFLVH